MIPRRIDGAGAASRSPGTFFRLALFCALCLPGARGREAAAVEVSPVLNARLLAGQYFFENQESNLSGNVGLLAAPAIAFNPKWTVVPTLSSSWRGTKTVQDLVGGGTLLQQTQDHSINVKGIRTAMQGAWQFKAGSGYRLQLLKETQDENWDKGLYDFEKPSANLEAERFFGKEASLRAGYDFYWINFRNFSSLESQQRDLGRENAGSKTLNTNNHAAYLSGRVPFPFLGQKASFEGSYYHTLRNYTDQRTVLPTGELTPDLRRDKSQISALSVTLPFDIAKPFKLLADVRAGYSMLGSNQHNYDARKTRFNRNYYAYKDLSTGANLSYVVGTKPLVFTTGFSFARRNYDDRPVQDADGNYGSDRIKINEYYLNLGGSYPIDKNFRLQVLANFGWSRSNMKYEKTYRYNYETFAYLMGVVYDY